MSTRVGVGPDGKVYCKHLEEAAKRKSNTSKHPNRDFYCCKKFKGDEDKCDFWVWADELFPKPGENTVHASSLIPRTPSRQSAGPASPRRTSSPHTFSPQKHSPPSSTSTKTVTPRSGRRLEGIATGLKQREYDLSPVRHPDPVKEPEACSPLSIVPTMPQPPSPVPTEVDSGEAEEPPRKFSFLGLQYSPESVVATIKDEGQPSTPKKRRLSGTSQLATEAETSADGVLLTPPQSRQQMAESTKPAPLTGSRKGKEREHVLPAHNQDGSNNEEAEAEDVLPLFTCPDETSTISSVSPTIAENVLDYGDGMRARVKALAEYMDSFDIAQAAKLLQTIERQKIQYECRDKSQKKRIEELTAERDRLADEVARLKEELRQ